MDIFDELIAGWAGAMDEIDLLSKYEKDAVTVKYAVQPCFELENYTPESFLPGNAMLDSVPKPTPHYYVKYGLAADGLPCYCKTFGREGLPIFSGFYRYSPETVEFLEYNLANGIPKIFQRLVFKNGQKLRWLKAVANGGGNAFNDMTREQAIAVAKKDERCIFLHVQQFEYENDRIVRDIANLRAPGAGIYGFTGHYSYDTTGKLIEIKDKFTSGGERLRYVYWDESEGLQGLSDRLTAAMAEAIINALMEENIDTPMAMLQLSYRYAVDYIPTPAPMSVKEREEIIENNDSEVWQFLFLSNNFIDNLHLTGIEPTFTQFMNQVESREGHNLARAMLQKTAALLTTSRLLGRIPTDPEFFAFAIDNSVEGHDAEDFKDILLKCGLPEKQYDDWRARGWMRD